MVMASRQTISSECGLSLRAISSGIATLEKAGWVVAERTTLCSPGNKFVRVMKLWLSTSSANMYSGLYSGARPDVPAPRRPHSFKAVAAATPRDDYKFAIPDKFFPVEPVLLNNPAASLLDLVVLRKRLMAAYNDLATGASTLPLDVVNAHGQQLHTWQMQANDRIKQLEKEIA